MKLAPFYLTLILCLAASISAAERKWSDSSGRFSITAELVSVADGKVTLKQSDGSTITLPVSSLSKTDQEFLRSTLATKKDVKTGKPKSDIERIQGVWWLTDQWVNGERTDVSEGRIAFRFRKNLNEYGRVRNGGFQPIGRPSTFTLDASKTPKQMDVIAPEAAEKVGGRTTKKTSAASRTTFVTYTLEGDTLILCRVLGKNGKIRPKAAPEKGTKGDDLLVMVCTRVGSRDKFANPAATPREDEKPSTKIPPDKKAVDTKVDRKLTAELTGIRIVRERTSGPMGDRQTTSTELTLWIKGQGRTNSRDSIVQLSQLAPIVDDQGNLLSTEKRLEAIEFYQRDARTQLTYNGPEGSGPMLVFLVDAPARKATKIKKIKGRVEITTTGTQRIVFEKLSTLLGKPLKHELLGDLRIIPELTVGGRGTELTLHMTGKHHLVKSWHLEDDGRPVRASSEHKGRRHPTIKEVGRGYAARVSEKAALVLTVRTAGVKQVVDFEFTDVKLP